MSNTRCIYGFSVKDYQTAIDVCEALASHLEHAAPQNVNVIQVLNEAACIIDSNLIHPRGTRND